MTDRYERIRAALAMGPTPGPWEVANGTDVFTKLGARNAAGVEAAANDGWHIADCDMGPSFTEEGEVESYIPYVEKRANAALIAACDSDTIRELLAERDQLAGAITAQAQEIAELREKAERLWIDAKERLPQEGQRVVCEYKTGEVWAGRYRKAIRCERWMPIDRAIEGAKP